MAPAWSTWPWVLLPLRVEDGQRIAVSNLHHLARMVSAATPWAIRQSSRAIQRMARSLLLQAIPALVPAAKEKLAAQALIDFLRKESAASVMKAKGLEPVAP